MQSELKMLEFAARLSLLEKMVGDLMLTNIYHAAEPMQEFERVRQLTAMSLVQVTAPPGTTAEDADVALAVQTKMIEFAERFFDQLRDELENALKKYPGHDL